MANIYLDSQKAIRSEAERFLSEYGFSTPPLPPEDAIAARNLVIDQQISLDDILIKTKLTSSEQLRVQAMLNMGEKAITFKDGLPLQKKRWGMLHEVGHEFLPWHRELLYYCSFLDLPSKQLLELEVEADMFAAEAFFFGRQFIDLVNKEGFGITSAIALVDEKFKTSYQSALVRMVEDSDIPCCLLVWRNGDELSDPVGLFKHEVHYFVRSKEFRLYSNPKKVPSDEVIAKLFSDPSEGVVYHKLIITHDNGLELIAEAESFCNGYNVFSLVYPPKLNN